MTDQEREQRIEKLRQDMHSAHLRKDRVGLELAWLEMETLIRGRSEQQVARMERERGLV